MSGRLRRSVRRVVVLGITVDAARTPACGAASSDTPGRRAEGPLYPRRLDPRHRPVPFLPLSVRAHTRGPSSEAFSARDSAVSAGRSAADRAGTAARSAVDRVLVVVAAGVGLVLANKGDLITRPITLGLLGLAAALILGAGLLAFHLDLPAAARSVDLFRAELEQHAEVLVPRDIQTIAQLPSLVDGSEEVGRARAASMAIIGVAVLALLSLAGTVIAGQVPTQPVPTASTTTVTTGRVPTTVTPPLTFAPPPVSAATSNP